MVGLNPELSADDPRSQSGFDVGRETRRTYADFEVNAVAADAETAELAVEKHIVRRLAETERYPLFFKPLANQSRDIGVKPARKHFFFLFDDCHALQMAFQSGRRF